MSTPGEQPAHPGNEVRFWRNRTLLCVAVVIAALVEVGTSQVTNSPRWMAIGGCILALLFLLFTVTALAAWRDARRPYVPFPASEDRGYRGCIRGHRICGNRGRWDRALQVGACCVRAIYSGLRAMSRVLTAVGVPHWNSIATRNA